MPDGYAGTECVLGNTNKTRIDVLENSDNDQWDAINALRNRLPLWATFVISGLSASVGIAVTIIIAVKTGA